MAAASGWSVRTSIWFGDAATALAIAAWRSSVMSEDSAAGVISAPAGSVASTRLTSFKSWRTFPGHV